MSEIERITHMPMLSREEQPGVAVITLLYAEKLAVDAMMDGKTTYIKYKTEGTWIERLSATSFYQPRVFIWSY